MKNTNNNIENINITINNTNNTQSIIGAMKADNRNQLGQATVTLPSGRKLPFYYNGEDDKQLAIKFATICYEATQDDQKCMALMYSCFRLLTAGISPDEVITEYGEELYLDYSKKVVVDGSATVLVELTDEEKKLFKSKPQIKHILLEKLKQYEEEQCRENEEDYDDGYKDGYEEGYDEGFGDGKQYFADKYLRR